MARLGRDSVRSHAIIAKRIHIADASHPGKKYSPFLAMDSKLIVAMPVKKSLSLKR